MRDDAGLSSRATHEALEIGRDCAGVLLDDPGVSRRHLLLRPEGDTVEVEDLGSTNGTTLDGERLDFGDQRWFDVLTTHNQIVRDRLVEHDSVEVTSQGDGFMLTFPSARRALECMIAAQRDARRPALR